MPTGKNGGFCSSHRLDKRHAINMDYIYDRLLRHRNRRVYRKAHSYHYHHNQEILILHLPLYYTVCDNTAAEHYFYFCRRYKSKTSWHICVASDLLLRRWLISTNVTIWVSCHKTRMHTPRLLLSIVDIYFFFFRFLIKDYKSYNNN